MSIIDHQKKSQAMVKCLRDLASTWNKNIKGKPNMASVLTGAADHIEALQHNCNVLEDAVMKSCGDNIEVVEATIESQGTLK